MTPEAVIAAVRAVNSLKAPPRMWTIQMKAVAAALLWEHTGLTYFAIGKLLGGDGGSLIHSARDEPHELLLKNARRRLEEGG
jgi:hypothetical protein